MAKWSKSSRPSRQDILRILKYRSRASLAMPGLFAFLGSLAFYPFYHLADMQPNDMIASAALILMLLLMGIIAAFNHHLLKANEDLIKIERRYADFIGSQHNAVSRLMGQSDLTQAQWDDMRRTMVREAARLLDVDRVALWLYDDQQRLLSLELRYERASRLFSTGVTLDGGRFPRYFAALNQNPHIDAHDACEDPRLADFRGGYLEDNDIRSVLDTKLFIAGHLGGILSVEKTGEPRRWTAADITFAARIGDIISLAYEARHMRDLRDKLMSQAGLEAESH